MDVLEAEACRLTGPWIFYDGDCPLCRGGERRFGPMVRRRGIRLATLQSERGRHFAGQGEDEMKVLTHEGQVIGGVEGFVYVSSYVWWARPLGWAWRWRRLRPMFQRVYRNIAKNRGCDGACGIKAQRAEERS
jgi:predicted DCC family thiol-disulfide oxidoreductase YuxK